MSVENEDGFGTSDRSAPEPNFKKYSRFKVKEATKNIWRIFPRMKSLRNTPKGHRHFSRVHWGYSGVNFKDPTKTSFRPFLCVEEYNYKTKMVVVPCDECVKIKAKEVQLEDIEIACRQTGKTPDETALMMAPLKAWLNDHNRDSKWNLAACNPSFEFGVLKLSNTNMKKLDLLFDELQAKGIDPLALDQGVWVEFTRNNKNGLDDVVSVVNDMVEATLPDGTKVSAPVLRKAPITAEQAKAALEAIPDLATFETAVTREQVKLLAKCSGDPEEVTAIFNMTQPNREQSPRSPAPTRQVQTIPTGPSTTEQIVALQAQAAALAATQVVMPPVGTVVTLQAPTEPTPTPPPTEVKTMTNEEFMKKFGQ